VRGGGEKTQQIVSYSFWNKVKKPDSFFLVQQEKMATIIDLLKACENMKELPRANAADMFIFTLRNALNEDKYAAQIAHALGCERIRRHFESKQMTINWAVINPEDDNEKENVAKSRFIGSCPPAPKKPATREAVCRPTPPDTPL